MLVNDVRGGVQLVVDGIHDVTRVAEGLHATIAAAAPALGPANSRPARGIAGLVYPAIRGTSALIGRGLDLALAGVQAALPQDADRVDSAGSRPRAKRRDALVSAINGIVGDHLERSCNRLAIPMQLLPARREGSRLLLLIHGLCMSEHVWTGRGPGLGDALSTPLGYTPVYLRYNSGQHISTNGAQLASLLEELIAHWPVEVETLAVVGHSMGGLVARSAVRCATDAAMAWPQRLRCMIFLGTPHHGAALERGGNWLHRGFGVSPYLAPFARLSGLRSAGITDLRHGNLLDRDWADDRFARHDARTPVALPRGVACYAVAGSLGKGRMENAIGDGLVSVSSALGRHAQAHHDLRLPASHTWTARGVGHLALLNSAAVHEKLHGWLDRAG